MKPEPWQASLKSFVAFQKKFCARDDILLIYQCFLNINNISTKNFALGLGLGGVNNINNINTNLNNYNSLTGKNLNTNFNNTSNSQALSHSLNPVKRGVNNKNTKKINAR